MVMEKIQLKGLKKKIIALPNERKQQQFVTSIIHHRCKSCFCIFWIKTIEGILSLYLPKVYCSSNILSVCVYVNI